MTDAVTVNDVGDILYVRLREGRIAATKALGDDRLVDVDADCVVLGVEFIGIGDQFGPTRFACTSGPALRGQRTSAFSL